MGSTKYRMDRFKSREEQQTLNDLFNVLTSYKQPQTALNSKSEDTHESPRYDEPSGDVKPAHRT